MARRDQARRGMAWQARLGTSRPGALRLGEAGSVRPVEVWRVLAWFGRRGMVSHGRVRRGATRRDRARQARQGKTGQGRTSRGLAGMAWHVEARYGSAWRGRCG